MDNSVTEPLPRIGPIWRGMPGRRRIVPLMHTDTALAAHTAALTLAGDDYRWTHAAAPSTLTTAHRRGLTILLASAQGGACLACGDDLAGEPVELCHIVASRRGGYGIMAGNVYAGHKGCNDDDAKTFGDVVPLASLAGEPVLTFPTRAECLAAARVNDDTRATRLARRKARMA